MKRVLFTKIVFSFLLLVLLAGCGGSDYFTLSEYEQYLINLKQGILDKPALTVQRLPQKMYFSVSSVKEGFCQYDFEILCVPQENQRAVKSYDVYNMFFEAEVQDLSGQKINASIKELKIVSEQKQNSLALSNSVSIKNGKLHFSQEIPLKNYVLGLKEFSVVLTIQTEVFEQVVLVPSALSREHLKSENIEIEFVDSALPDIEENVTLTFKNQDGSVLKTVSQKPFSQIVPPTPAEKPLYKFVGWKNLPALCPQADAEYEPVFAPVEYAITYMLDGGVNSRGNPDYYTIETPKFVLHPATREGYIFEGWYKERVFRTRVTRVEQGTAEDMVLYAKFSLPVEGGGQITLNKNEMVLYSGQNEQLVADIVLLLDGSSPPVMWTSNNEDVVVVDSEGNVTALNVEKETTAVVTASYSDLNASCKITVIPVE